MYDDLVKHLRFCGKCNVLVDVHDCYHYGKLILGDPIKEETT